MDKIDEQLENHLIALVAEYIVARKKGNIPLAKGLRDIIYRDCKQYNLDTNFFFFYFGDPDHPDTRDEVYAKVEEFLFVERLESFDEEEDE